MKKLKVGLFTDAFYPMIDGVGMVVHNHAKNLLKYCDVYVIAPDYKDSYDDSKLPYKVIRVKSKKMPIIDYSVALPKLDKTFKDELSNLDLDIVHIHSPFTIGKVGVEYAKKNNIPLFGTMHSQYKSDFLRATNSKFISTKLTDSIIEIYDKCNLCYAVNYSTGEIFYNDYGYKCMPKVLNNATEMTPLKKHDNYINELYKLDDDTKVFLFVGRLNKLKNIFFIVDSLNELNNICNFKYKMLFVGDGQDKDELINHINKNKLNNNIILCGKIKDREILKNIMIGLICFYFHLCMMHLVLYR